jgi:hypothetical protein
MEQIDHTGLVDGHACREIVFERKRLVPLHLGHALYLLANPEQIPAGWGNDGFIQFFGLGIQLRGKEVVPSLRRFKGDKSWWLHWDNLAERAAPYKVAVIARAPE